MFETIIALAIKHVVLTQILAGSFTGIALGIVCEKPVRKAIRKSLGGN